MSEQDEGEYTTLWQRQDWNNDPQSWRHLNRQESILIGLCLAPGATASFAGYDRSIRSALPLPLTYTSAGVIFAYTSVRAQP